MSDQSQSGSQSGGRRAVTKGVPLSLKAVLFDKWKKSWNFERLLFVLLVLFLPVLIVQSYEGVVSAIAFNHEVGNFVTELRGLKSMAHDNNTSVYIKARPASPDGFSSYHISFGKAELGQREVRLPAGLTIAGLVNFDPQGVPNGPCEMTLRSGLNVRKIKIDRQGTIMAP